MKVADLRGMFINGFKGVEHQPFWYLLTLPSYSINFLSNEDSRKQRRGPWWPWTSRWGRHPNEILSRLVVQPKYRSSKKKLHVRT